MYLVLCGEVDDGVLRRRLAALFLRREEARRVEVLRVGLGRRGRLALCRRRRAAEKRIHEGEIGRVVVVTGVEDLVEALSFPDGLLACARNQPVSRVLQASDRVDGVPAAKLCTVSGGS